MYENIEVENVSNLDLT